MRLPVTRHLEARARGVLTTPRPFVSEASANWLTHALGLLLALLATPPLVLAASATGNDGHVVGMAVYGLTLALLYASSTRYHLFQGRRGEYARLITDHVCIFLLIAGTQTAVCVLVMPPAAQFFYIGAMWMLALGGVIFKMVFGLRHERLGVGLYVLMGWLAVASLWPVADGLSVGVVTMLLLGGVAYTAGLIFYARMWFGRVRYSHAIWHLMVVMGSAFHYLAIRSAIDDVLRAA